MNRMLRYRIMNADYRKVRTEIFVSSRQVPVLIEMISVLR